MAGRRFDPGVIVQGMAGAAAVAFNVALSPIARRWYRRWGASDEEVQRALPGDELVRQPRSQMTLAVSIRASADQVWPWVVQIGCKRAGWYSYDLLDNGGVPSADRIIDAYQQLSVGDAVPFTPDGAMGFPVVAVEPGRALVMGGTTDTSSGEPADPHDAPPARFFSGAIIFYLYQPEPAMTRLLYRMPLGWNPGRLNTVMYRWFLEPISFVMARKTLLGIRQRVESAHARVIREPLARPTA